MQKKKMALTNSELTSEIPSVQPQRLATTSGTVALDSPGAIVIPEVPKDAFLCKAPQLWLIVALIELAVIGWLIYQLKKVKPQRTLSGKKG